MKMLHGCFTIFDSYLGLEALQSLALVKESAKFCWCQGLMQLPSIADLADLEALRWHRM